MPTSVSSTSVWSREQDKQFEKAFAAYPVDSSDRWEKISADIPGKSLEEVKNHYEILIDDVGRIESGCIPLPCYSSTSYASDEGAVKKGGKFGHLNGDSGHGGKASRSDQERRKGIAWTEDEHRLFLLGLEKYGKGDWRSISQNFVVTRTPTQVASHAQKYFIRLNSMNKDRRRPSIHDITSVNGGDAPCPITGGSSIQSPVIPRELACTGTNNSTTNRTASRFCCWHSSESFTTRAHGLWCSISNSGPMVPGASINVGPIAYPVPHTTAHR